MRRSILGLLGDDVWGNSVGDVGGLHCAAFLVYIGFMCMYALHYSQARSTWVLRACK